MRRAREVQVGATIVGAIALTLWGVTWLKEFSLANKTNVWHVTFPQTGGLSDSDEIRVNGVRMGEVEKVALMGDHVVVDLALDDEVRLTSASRVAISNIGMMGEKVIAVSLSTGGVPLAPRDTIIGVYEKGIAEVMSDMGTTVDAVTRLALQVERIVAVTDREGGLDQTFANFHRTSQELKQAVSENRVMLRETLANLNSASKTAKSLTTDREDQFKRTIDSFERSAAGMENLTVRLDSLRTSIQTVSTRVERGDGSLGLLVNDPRLYEETKASVAQFRELVEDIKRNPKKYVKLSIF